MKIAIVGSSRLSENEERDAQQFIGTLLNTCKEDYGNDLEVVSGGAKGVDTIAEEVAKSLGIKTMIYRPEVEEWEVGCKIGYKVRNMAIANRCDIIYCLPANLKRTRCYHCDKDHEKSGGCWTMKQVKEMGKPAVLIQPINRS